jgi:GAF domain-containing protein
MSSRVKRELYESALGQLESLVRELDDSIAVMASCASVLHHNLPYASWTGFYRVVAPELLRIGPYQGPVGCVEIPFHQGVCGAAARERKTQLVPDVHAFEGHIACDPAACSEIVVPVDDRTGSLFGVLDIDSHQPAAFDDEDRRGLEKIVRRLASHL